jgi:hypothetical protein
MLEVERQSIGDALDTMYRYVDRGDYQIFDSADITKGTYTMMTIEAADGFGQYFSRVKNAAFLTQDTKLVKFIHQYVIEVVCGHPDKLLMERTLRAFHVQLGLEFPTYEFPAEPMFRPNSGYDYFQTWQVLKPLVESLESEHAVLRHWKANYKREDPATARTYHYDSSKWGPGWNGQPEKEWKATLERLYNVQVQDALKLHYRKLDLGLDDEGYATLQKEMAEMKLAEEQSKAEQDRRARVEAAKKGFVERTAREEEARENAEKKAKIMEDGERFRASLLLEDADRHEINRLLDIDREWAVPHEAWSKYMLEHKNSERLRAEVEAAAGEGKTWAITLLERWNKERLQAEIDAAAGKGKAKATN